MANRPHIASKLKRINERNDRILKRFKEFDMSKYKLEYVLDQIADEYCLAPQTIYQIIRAKLQENE